jgi:hypothetical protein
MKIICKSSPIKFFDGHLTALVQTNSNGHMKSFFVFSALLCSLVLAQQVSVQSSLMRGVVARGIREDPDKYKNVTELSTYMQLSNKS